MDDSQAKPVESGQPENVRPWGRYDVLDSGEGFQVKRITINPGSRFSYQRHLRRSETWVIVQGEGLMTVNGVTEVRHPGDVIEIPAEIRHRAASPGPDPLVFIEVQRGHYLGEDDIERLEDDYGRVNWPRPADPNAAPSAG